MSYAEQCKEVEDNSNLKKKLKELLKSYEPDFDFELPHWDNGNFDDSFEYGQECGEQFILIKLKKIVEGEQNDN